MPCIYLLHRNPAMYERPDEFRPERFIGRQPAALRCIPFGGGVRRCLGSSFALAEMRAVMETVLRAFELRPRAAATSGWSAARSRCRRAGRAGGRAAASELGRAAQAAQRAAGRRRLPRPAPGPAKAGEGGHAHPLRPIVRPGREETGRMDDRNGVTEAGHGRPLPDGRALTPGLAARRRPTCSSAPARSGRSACCSRTRRASTRSGMLAVQVASMVTALLLVAARRPRAALVRPRRALRRRCPRRWSIVFTELRAPAPTCSSTSGSRSTPSTSCHRGRRSGSRCSPSPNYAAVLICFRRRPVRRRTGPTRTSRRSCSLTGTVAIAGVFILLLRERVGAADRRSSPTPRAPTRSPGCSTGAASSDVVESELRARERSDQPFSLLLGDCDFFKHLNDPLGHQAGDEALRAIGAHARGRQAAHRRRRAHRRRGVRAHPARHRPARGVRDRRADAHPASPRCSPTQPVPLTMSLGVATYPTHGTDGRRPPARGRRGALRRQGARPRPQRPATRRGRRDPVRPTATGADARATRPTSPPCSTSPRRSTCATPAPRATRRRSAATAS